MFIRHGFDRNDFRDFQAIAFEADDFLRVVREETHLAHAEVEEDLRADAVVAQLGGEAEFFIGFDRIETLLLKFVGVDFCGQTDAAAFVLAHVKEDAAAGAFDHLERGVELRAAIAATRAEDVAGEAFAMDADERGLGFGNLAFHECEMVCAIDERAIHVQVEIAVVGRHLDDLLTLDEPFTRATVGDEIFDAAQLQLVLAAKFQQLRQTRHRPIRVQDFAKHARRRKPREPRQIHARLRVPSAPQHAARFCAQRENVAGLHEIVWRRFGVGENTDRLRAIVGTDASRDLLRRIDGDREIRAVTLAIFQHHPLKAELLRAFIRDRRADESTPVHGHKVHRFRRHLLRRHHEIAFVLAICVIGHDHEFPGANIFEDVFDGVELRIGGHG